MVYFKVLGMHWPRLIGAFVVLIALLMFFSSIYQLNYISTTIANLPDCVASVKTQADFEECRAAVKDATSFRLKSGQAQLTAGQTFASVALPISAILFWLAVLLFGAVLYKAYSPRVIAAKAQPKKAKGARRRKKR